MSRSPSPRTAASPAVSLPRGPTCSSTGAGCSIQALSVNLATAIRERLGCCSISTGCLLRSNGSHIRLNRRRTRCANEGCRGCWPPGLREANDDERGMRMAELTNLESKLGEVIGLAMAAQGVTQKVTKLEDVEGDLTQTLERMQQEAEEAEERATEVAG